MEITKLASFHWHDVGEGSFRDDWIGINVPHLFISFQENRFYKARPRVENILTPDTTIHLIEAVKGEFARATGLIRTLDDRSYIQWADEKSSIGTHFRHNYDFAKNCLIGLRTAKIDYSMRERDTRIEQDREYAVERIIGLIESFETMPMELLGGQIQVRSEVDGTMWHVSSAPREIEFLYSHTVHHHAMIAEKLKSLSIVVPDGFGVALSTLEFWNKQKKAI